MVRAYKRLLKCLLVTLCTIPYKSETVSAVTYEFSGGRFGDNLVAYCHAKWVSYKCGIPLLYRPFEYSDQLKLHTLERPSFNSESVFYKKRIMIGNYSSPVEISKEEDFLYIIDYFGDSPCDLPYAHFPFPVDWNDVQFLQQIKEYIAPLNNISHSKLPENYLNIALHVRRPSGKDKPHYTTTLPYKMPPDSYYLEQIKTIAQAFPDKKLNVHIFTDSLNSQEILSHYRNSFKDLNVLFSCRENDNAHNKNVIEDFFALMQYDCLVRSESNFSIMAAKLANYAMEISPKHIITKDDQIVVDEITIVKKNKGLRNASKV